MNTTLVFVYNADSGLFNALSDVAHKIFSPATYACNLCAITHSAFGMRKEWKEFLESLDVGKEFIHSDELKRLYGIEGAALPAIFRKSESGLELLIDDAAINACKSMAELKRLIAVKLTSEPELT